MFAARAPFYPVDESREVKSRSRRGRLRPDFSTSVLDVSSLPMTAHSLLLDHRSARCNSLPEIVQSALSLTFRRKLKLHLFRQSYYSLVIVRDGL